MENETPGPRTDMSADSSPERQSAATEFGPSVTSKPKWFLVREADADVHGGNPVRAYGAAIGRPADGRTNGRRRHRRQASFGKARQGKKVRAKGKSERWGARAGIARGATGVLALWSFWGSAVLLLPGAREVT
ncbi:hypothetical protein MPTK1_1g10580 [Marchantia polymorpha subsp. ruderalis]|uniref:Uncharacterized protein n=2 Tax=Marchantia polymorpha TaxID=3197 RepID=A0AAF6ANP8_MARPO|nr:hypothetical protein MARPO_0014s0169 [Marchantia polymorpha]BBM98068.1 hypothetical protein Mp_1g10580 [Marchantia polymorpha subsp. ruderalis]|eukprot:PTQ45658.1 hypothetical protein MARPO_0014s0169 [Marchantia polymorpha]